ncbi:MAG: hypothetical protein OHK0015_24720 [Chloroflexi bacterium OHK40]
MASSRQFALMHRWRTARYVRHAAYAASAATEGARAWWIGFGMVRLPVVRKVDKSTFRRDNGAAPGCTHEPP